MADGDALFLAAPLDLTALANALDLCPFTRLAAAADVAAWHPPAQRPCPAQVPVHVLPRNRRIRPRPRVPVFSSFDTSLHGVEQKLRDLESRSENTEAIAKQPSRISNFPRTPPRPPVRGVRPIQIRQHDLTAPRVRLDLRLDPAGVFITPSPKKRRTCIHIDSPNDVRATALDF